MIIPEPSPRAFRRHLRKIVPPADSYRGRRAEENALPDNLLLFVRFHARELPPPSKPPNFHHRHVMIVPFEGEGPVFVDGKSVILRPGTGLLIRPHQFHHYALPRTRRITWLFVTFEWSRPVRTRNLFTPSAHFREELRKLIDAYIAGDPASPLLWRLGLMLEELKAAKPTESPRVLHAEDRTWPAQVHRLMASDLSRAWTIGELAERLRVSPGHLRLVFRQTVGLSLGKYLRICRLQRAAEMLSQGKYSVKQVAEETGWLDPFSLSRAFKGYWKRSPKQFALAIRAAGKKKS